MSEIASVSYPAVGAGGRPVVGGLGVLWRRTQADWCVQGAGMGGELREWMGLRFWVDAGSKARDAERHAQGR